MVSTLRPLDESKGMSFHTLSLLEDHCVVCRLRIWAEKCLRKSSGRSWRLWVSVSRESRSSAPVSLQGLPPNTPLYCVGSVGTRGGETAFSDPTLWPASLGEDIQHPERPSAVQALLTDDMHPGVLLVLCLIP